MSHDEHSSFNHVIQQPQQHQQPQQQQHLLAPLSLQNLSNLGVDQPHYHHQHHQQHHQHTTSRTDYRTTTSAMSGRYNPVVNHDQRGYNTDYAGDYSNPRLAYYETDHEGFSHTIQRDDPNPRTVERTTYVSRHTPRSMEPTPTFVSDHAPYLSDNVDGEYRQVVHVTSDHPTTPTMGDLTLQESRPLQSAPPHSYTSSATVIHHHQLNSNGYPLVDDLAVNRQPIVPSYANPTRSAPVTRATNVDVLSVPVNETLTVGYTPDEIGNGPNHADNRLLLDNGPNPEHNYVVGKVRQTAANRKPTDDHVTSKQERKEHRKAERNRRQLEKIPPVKHGRLLPRNQLPDHRLPLATGVGDTDDDSSSTLSDSDYEARNWSSRRRRDYVTEEEEEEFVVAVKSKPRDNPFHERFAVQRENPLFSGPPAQPDIVAIQAPQVHSQPPQAKVKRRISLQSGGETETAGESEIVRESVPVRRTVPVQAYPRHNSPSPPPEEERRRRGRDVVDSNLVKRTNRDEYGIQKKSRSKSRDKNYGRSIRGGDYEDDDGFDQNVNVTRG